MILYSVLAKSGENYPFVKKNFKIYPKILFKVSSSNSAIDTKLTCLKNLGVINVLPPPGCPIAPTNIQSTNFLKGLSFSEKLYHPP